MKTLLAVLLLRPFSIADLFIKILKRIILAGTDRWKDRAISTHAGREGWKDRAISTHAGREGWNVRAISTHAGREEWIEYRTYPFDFASHRIILKASNYNH